MASSVTKVLYVLGGLVGCLVLGFLLLFVLALLLYRTEVAVFTHAPTADLFETGDLDAKKLIPFTADGVTVYASIVDGHPPSVTLVSKSEGAVTLRRVLVAGLGAQAKLEHTVDVERELKLELSKDGQLFRTPTVPIRLVLPREEMAALTAAGVKVTVVLQVAGGVEREVALEFTRTTKTVTAWPT